jgi:protein-L-isoaspartate O-methyltransferase
VNPSISVVPKRTLGRKRCEAGIWLVVLLFAAANYFLDLGAVGGYSGAVLAAVVLAMHVWIIRRGPTLRELRAYQRLKRLRRESPNNRLQRAGDA